MAASVCEYATPAWPFGREAVVMVSVAGAIVRERFALAVCAGDAESVTLKVNGVAVTGDAGVQLISPLDAFRVRPVDNVPAVNCQV